MRGVTVISTKTKQKKNMFVASLAVSTSPTSTSVHTGSIIRQLHLLRPSSRRPAFRGERWRLQSAWLDRHERDAGAAFLKPSILNLSRLHTCKRKALELSMSAPAFCSIGHAIMRGEIGARPLLTRMKQPYNVRLFFHRKEART